MYGRRVPHRLSRCQLRKRKSYRGRSNNGDWRFDHAVAPGQYRFFDRASETLDRFLVLGYVFPVWNGKPLVTHRGPGPARCRAGREQPATDAKVVWESRSFARKVRRYWLFSSPGRVSIEADYLDAFLIVAQSDQPSYDPPDLGALGGAPLTGERVVRDWRPSLRWMSLATRGWDENGTLIRLRAHRTEGLEPLLARHGMRRAGCHSWPM